MIYKVETVNALLGELHVTASDISKMPIIIEDPLITELHVIDDGLFDPEKAFKTDPREVQTGDWNWETYRGGIIFLGKVNPEYFPFSIEFYLKGVIPAHE